MLFSIFTRRVVNQMIQPFWVDYVVAAFVGNNNLYSPQSYRLPFFDGHRQDVYDEYDCARANALRYAIAHRTRLPEDVLKTRGIEQKLLELVFDARTGRIGKNRFILSLMKIIWSLKWAKKRNQIESIA